MRNFIKYTIFAIHLLTVVIMTLGILSTRVSPYNEFYILLPYFGFAFPIFYILQLGFLIFWCCFKKWWFVLFAFICLCIAFPYFNREIPITGSEKAADGQKITVVSYNVEFLGHGKRFNQIMDEIKSVDPDIVCLQEFGFYKKKGTINADEVHREFAKNYPYRHLWYKNDFKHLRYGVVTYSKYPIINKEKVQYKSKNNISIFSDVVIGTDTVRVFNNHLESYRLNNKDMDIEKNSNEEDLWKMAERVTSKMGKSYLIRALQADEISYAVHHSPYPTICLGDFNEIPTSYVYNKIRGNQQDLFVATNRGYDYTWRRNRWMRFRIDHIMCSSTLTPIKSQIIHSGNSDHDALVGVIALH